MPSGWEVYYVVFLSAVLALGIPAILGLIALLFRAKKPPKEVPVLPESPQAPATPDTQLGRRINTRFFLGANVALILITFGLMLIPCVGTLRPETNHSDAVRGLIAILTLASCAALGLLYSARKGDLNWLKSYRQEEPHP